MGEKPTNTKKVINPYKREIYDAYVTWRSIPASLRARTTEEASKALIEGNALFEELLQIRTQTEFAEKYRVENSTLSNWNKLIKFVFQAFRRF